MSWILVCILPIYIKLIFFNRSGKKNTRSIKAFPCDQGVKRMQSGAVGGHRFPLSQKLLWKCTRLMQPVSFKRLQGWGEYYQK